MEDATLPAKDVGVPTNKQRVFIVACKRKPEGTTHGLSAKLSRWKRRLRQPASVGPAHRRFLLGARWPLLFAEAAGAEESDL